MRTIQFNCDNEIVIKNSRFICWARNDKNDAYKRGCEKYALFKLKGMLWWIGEWYTAFKDNNIIKLTVADQIW